MDFKVLKGTMSQSKESGCVGILLAFWSSYFIVKSLIMQRLLYTLSFKQKKDLAHVER